MKIHLIGDFLPMGDYEEKLLKFGRLHKHPSSKNKEELLVFAKGADIIVTHDSFTEDVLKELPSLKFLISWSTGLDNIDVVEAKRQGIIVKNTPDYCTQSVAEYIIALIFSLVRKIPWSFASVKNNSWDCSSFKGIEVKGKTLGIIGYGRIGQKLEQLARGLGMDVLITNRTPLDLSNYCSFNEILERSDIISLCVDLNESTKNLINAEAFRLMKTGAYLINASRGKIIDDVALFSALRDRKLAGAAIDVVSNEPNVPSELINTNNLIITPHNAWNTDEAIKRGARQIFELIEEYCTK